MFLLILFIIASFYIPTAKESSLNVPLNVGSVYRSSSPPQHNAWVGSAITAGASFLGGLLGGRQQSKNINKQIQAQQEENQKNREYNLMLAQQQNAWNVEQWERENEYNSPEKQMERFRKAGLNPDLMAGGAQNLSASSPAMTAGAASTATDMSALGQKPTLGQAIQTALRDSMLGAQIDNIKADTRQKNANAGITEIEERTMKAIESIRGTSLDAAEIPKDWSNNPYIASKLATYEKALEDAKIAAHSANIRGYDEFIRKIEKEFKRDEVQKQLEILSNQLDISRNEAEYLVKTLEARINGVTFETQTKEYEAILNSPKLIEKLPEGIKPLVSLLNLIFRGH